LLDRYEYWLDVAALLPRIALPERETRAIFAALVVAARERTLRALDAVVRVDARFATLRAAFVDLAAAREADVVPTVARDVVARLETVRAVVAPRGLVAVDVFVLRGLARPVRALAACGVAATVCTVGATGSANTARIDTNVEQTKNAPASKNTVPMAFL